VSFPSRPLSQFSLLAEVSGHALELAQSPEEAAVYAPVGAPAPGELAVDVAPTSEDYDRIYENRFVSARQQQMSTFALDVDTASYANVRRFLEANKLPPADAVRIEELINYFTYADQRPQGDVQFSVTTEVAPSPWATATCSCA
jgi:Ca-activated chloride channel homolog